MPTAPGGYPCREHSCRHTECADYITECANYIDERPVNGYVRRPEVSIMRHRSVLLMAAILLLSTFVACNRGKHLDLQEVSGSVSLDSQPLGNGTIQFSPLDKDGLASGSAIVEGKYRIPREKGLPPGKYTVRVSAADPSSAVPRPSGHGPGSEAPPLKERVPEKYNSRSELRAEVKSGGGNSLDFSLSSRPGK